MQSATNKYELLVNALFESHKNVTKLSWDGDQIDVWTQDHDKPRTFMDFPKQKIANDLASLEAIFESEDVQPRAWINQ